MAATFGDLIDALANNNDLCGLESVCLLINGEKTDIPPGYICSWRGSYALGCLTPGDRKKACLVRDLIRELTMASSGTVCYQGWKGGEYYFDRGTAVWFGEEGQYQDVAVQGITIIDSCVFVIINDEEY